MNATHTHTQFVIQASLAARKAHTVQLQDLMDAAQKLEIGERIKGLRERSPYTQPVMADKVGKTLRAYQQWEAKGTERWENIEAVADIHGVSPHWIYDGKETPDLMGSLSDAGQLDRIEALLKRVLSRLESGTRAAVVDEIPAPASSASRRAPGSSRTRRKASG